MREHSAPPPPPVASETSAAISQQNQGAAATEACAGLQNFKGGVGIARGAFIDRVDRANDWESSESLGVQGYYFSAVGAELDYLDTRVSPELPSAIVDAFGELRRTLFAVVDSDLRREPASISNGMVDAYSRALVAAESACKAAGAG
ncbi:hypothetical protein B7435_27115 [Mycolicibacterium peregrinum]|nr:hypothetical protein B7435_27115 [Mycolicibacterium peregrinum]